MPIAPALPLGLLKVGRWARAMPDCVAPLVASKALPGHGLVVGGLVSTYSIELRVKAAGCLSRLELGGSACTAFTPPHIQTHPCQDYHDQHNKLAASGKESADCCAGLWSP